MTQSENANPPAAAATVVPLWAKTLAVGLLLGAAIGAVGACGYYAVEFGLHSKVAETALVVYQQPGASVGWLFGAAQFLRSVQSYFIRLVGPAGAIALFRVYSLLVSLLLWMASKYAQVALWYNWIFLAHWSVTYGYSKAVQHKGSFEPPCSIFFDPLLVTPGVVSPNWASFSEHSAGTINVRRPASTAPKRLAAIWATGEGCMRLVGMAYVGNGVIATAAHVVTGNGGIIHYLKLGFEIVISPAHLHVSKGVKVMPLPKAMCDALISGKSRSWFAAPPPRSDNVFHPGDDHCVLRLPNINAILGIRVARTSFMPGKATFMPCKAYEYVFDDDAGCYTLYEQLGRVYDDQPCKGVIATSISSVPGMSGSYLFDTLSEGLLGLNIGTTTVGDGDIVSVAICIKQIYMYWTAVEPVADLTTFSWPKGRPTVDQHAGDMSSLHEGYFEVDPYEEMAEQHGYASDFNVGEWETAEEREGRLHRERDEVVALAYGTEGIDYIRDIVGGTYSLMSGRFKSHCADAGDARLPSSGRLKGFTLPACAVGCAVMVCVCCGKASGTEICSSCSWLLNLQHTPWTQGDIVPPLGFVPLSNFEQTLVSTLQRTSPVCFSNNSAGDPYLFEVGHSSVARQYNKSDIELPPADLLEKLGVAQTYYVPDRSETGVRDSLIANAEKRLVGNFGESMDHWTTFLSATSDSSVFFPVEMPEFGADLYASIHKLVFKLAQRMKLDKSAGWSGILFGCQLKGDLLNKCREDVLDCATRRIMRCMMFPEFAATLGPLELVRFGFRGLVVPEIKGELHAARKVVDKDGKRLAHPRWRSILMQDTADHLVHMFFEDGFNTGLIKNYEAGDLQSVIAYGSLIGLATNEEGLKRVHEVLGSVAGSEALRTSDVSGMDWCLGPSDVLAAAAVRAQRYLRSDNPHAQRYAYGSYVASLAESRSVYLVGRKLIAGNEGGVCQSGAFSTSEIDGFARVADARLSDIGCEVMAYGDDSCRSQWLEESVDKDGQTIIVPNRPIKHPGYVSSLDEREVEEGLIWTRGDQVNVCSRNFSALTPGKFELTSWPRCITRLAGISDPAQFAESAGGLLVECRFTDDAITRIRTIAEHRGFEVPAAARNFNVDEWAD